MAVDDTELEDGEEDLEDEDLTGTTFRKAFNIKKYVCSFKENMGGK